LLELAGALRPEARRGTPAQAEMTPAEIDEALRAS
jgi:hypothetical protein